MQYNLYNNNSKPSPNQLKLEEEKRERGETKAVARLLVADLKATGISIAYSMTDDIANI
jgi:hypothetical protein